MSLENKLGITDGIELFNLEEKISKKKAIELFKFNRLDMLQAGTFKSLAQLHKYLFDEIYDFAGKIRQVNLAKGNFRFAPLKYLNSYLQNIDRMPQSTFDEIIRKYVEMNIAHPFRRCNGRIARIWLNLMLKKELYKVIDWSKISKKDYLLAMEKSPVKDAEIKVLLQDALTDKINDLTIYMKGLDASYDYEGYNTYKSQDLL